MTGLNLVYLFGVDATMTGEVNLESDTLRAYLVSDEYEALQAHHHLDDVTDGRIDTVELTGKTVTDSVLHVDPVVFVDVGEGPTVGGLVVYQDTGDEATSVLLAFIGRRADTVPIAITATGGDLTFTFPNGIYKL